MVECRSERSVIVGNLGHRLICQIALKRLTSETSTRYSRPSRSQQSRGPFPKLPGLPHIDDDVRRQVMRTMTICLLVTATFHAVTAPQTPVPRALTVVWTLEGRWMGVASDESAGGIYAVGPARSAEVDISGQIRREMQLRCQFGCRPYAKQGVIVGPGPGVKLRLARRPQATFVTFFVCCAG